MTENKLKIGDYNELKVTGKTEGRFILESREGEIPLVCDVRGAEIATGEVLEVFVYPGTDGELVATLSTPYAVIDEFACMTVVDTNKYGAYLDWGIEKDLFVYRMEQPRPMKKGKKYTVYVRRDEASGRIQGTAFLEQCFNTDTSQLKNGEKVSLLIYGITEIGIMAVVNGQYSGMLYINECFEKLKIGDIKEGFIKKIREDGRIDLTLQPEISKAISNSKRNVLQKLQEADGFLPFHDKSDPEDIKTTFSLSKKNFKKAIGGLYKERRIRISDTGIHLIDNPWIK
ncbi:MAG: hypothetical protein GY866_36835 [Proteobacteria bacterium]|nr:hypothetical protein [Pseudomonadota bacterium]